MTRRVCTLLACALLACALLAGCAGAPAGEENVLRVGMECDYAPNNWQESTASDTNLPIENMPGYYADGYDVAIARLIGEALGKEVRVMKLAWDGLTESLNAGQIDMIIAGMADTEDRRQSVAFSVTYQPTIYVVMVNSDSPYAEATTLADLSGAAILGQKDTRYDEVIDQIPGVDHLTPVDSVPNMLSRLEQRTCDGIVVSRDTAVPYLETFPQFSLIEFAPNEGFDLGFSGACVGLRLEDEELLEQVNAVIGGLTQEDFDEMMAAAIERMPR